MGVGFELRQYKGFTLVELMVTLIVLMTLVLIAMPSYQTHIARGRRLEGQMCLLDKNCYPASMNGFYQIETVYQSSTEYTRQAVPVGAQAADRCGVLTLTNTYLKGAAQPDCWD